MYKLTYLQKLVEFKWKDCLGNEIISNYDPYFEICNILLYIGICSSYFADLNIRDITTPFYSPKGNNLKENYLNIIKKYEYSIKCLNSCLIYSKQISKNNSLCLKEDYLNGLLKYINGLYIVYLGEFKVIKEEISRKECGTYYARSVNFFENCLSNLKKWENIPLLGNRYTTYGFINNSNV